MDERTPIDIATALIVQFEEFYDIKLTRKGCIKIYKLVLQYSEDECIKSLDIAFAQYYNPVEALMKLGGILYNRARIRQRYIESEDNSDEVHD